MYRIHWRSRVTGAEGYGEWSDDADNLNTWIAAGNGKYRGVVQHWLEWML